MYYKTNARLTGWSMGSKGLRRRRLRWWKEAPRMISCNRYRLRISGNDYTCIKANGEKANHFIAPDTQDKIPKLYVVKNRDEVCYVGITSQGIGKRLRYGFKATGKNGYYGYKWKDKIKQAEIFVWCFPGTKAEHVEAIEGELVYLIREETGKWPRYQMEIHFHPEVTEPEKQIAQVILSQCTEK
jgi:hypothetical protein